MAVLTITSLLATAGLAVRVEHMHETMQFIGARIDQVETRQIETSRGDIDRTRVMEVTAYTRADDEGGPTAADGRELIPYYSAAVDPDVIPLGTRIYIPGIGTVEAHDTGAAIVGNKIDVCLKTKNEAYRWGRQVLPVRIGKMEEGKD